MATKKENKGFKPETIHKFIKAMRALVAFYLGLLASGQKLKACLTWGNRKLGLVLNDSLAPILTCGACSECKHWCYDIAACLFRIAVMMARARNTAILLWDPDEFFRQADAKISRTKRTRLFRWHVGGELMTERHFNILRKSFGLEPIKFNHLGYIYEIAKNHPDWKFWVYTKQHVYATDYIRKHGRPDNLVIMFSEWDGMPLYNPLKQPVFVCRMENGSNKNGDPAKRKNFMQCPGNCSICHEKGIGCINGYNVWNQLH